MACAQAGDRDAYSQLLRAIVPVIRALFRKQVAETLVSPVPPPPTGCQT
jgi:RNA polymerase sigma-70 factor (ECF subfamily)